jgi:copper chaperone
VDTFFIITGMACEQHAEAISAGVGQVPGVSTARTDLATGKLKVTSSQPVDEAAVRAAVTGAGCEVLRRLVT